MCAGTTHRLRRRVVLRAAPSCQRVRAAPCWIPPAQRLAVVSPVRGAFLLPRHPHDQGRLRSPLEPIEQGRDFGSLPCTPHRPTHAGWIAIRLRWKLRRTGRGAFAPPRTPRARAFAPLHPRPTHAGWIAISPTTNHDPGRGQFERIGADSRSAKP